MKKGCVFVWKKKKKLLLACSPSFRKQVQFRPLTQLRRRKIRYSLGSRLFMFTHQQQHRRDCHRIFHVDYKQTYSYYLLRLSNQLIMTAAGSLHLILVWLEITADLLPLAQMDLGCWLHTSKPVILTTASEAAVIV